MPPEKRLSDIIDECAAFGEPVLVSGYHIIMRGVSVRGTDRVPTALICYTGEKLPLEKAVQAMNRYTPRAQSQAAQQQLFFLLPAPSETLTANTVRVPFCCCI